MTRKSSWKGQNGPEVSKRANPALRKSAFKTCHLINVQLGQGRGHSAALWSSSVPKAPCVLSLTRAFPGALHLSERLVGMSWAHPPLWHKAAVLQGGSGGQDLLSITALLLSAGLGGGRKQICIELMETKQKLGLWNCFGFTGQLLLPGDCAARFCFYTFFVLFLCFYARIQEHFPFSECNNAKDLQAGASPQHFPLTQDAYMSVKVS